MFKSIGKAISNAYNSVKSAVSNVFGGGKTNTANAASPVFGSAAYMRQNSNAGYTYDSTGNKVKVSAGASGSWTPTLSAGQLSPGLNSGIASGSNSSGGVGSTSYGPQLPVTISAGRQSAGGGSSSPTLSLAGFNYGSFAPTTISAKTLGAQTGSLGGASLQSTGGSIGNPVSLSSAPTSVNPGTINNTGLAGTVAGYKQYNAKTGQFDDVTETSTNETELDASIKKQMDARKKLYEQYGVVDPGTVNDDPEVRQAQQQRQQIQDNLRGPTAELNAIVAKQNQDLLQLRQTGSQEGVTEAVYGGQQNAINYNAAIRALPLQASIASLQGDLALAQDYLTELKTQKTEQIKKQSEANKRIIDSIEGIMDDEDRKAGDAIKLKNDIETKKALMLEDYKYKVMDNVLQNAPTSLRANLATRIGNAEDMEGVAKAAGSYGGNVKDTIAVENARLQNQKLTQEIEANKPITGEYANIINGAAGLVPATKKQQVKQNIATSLANGDYKTAYAEISNAVSDGLTGTNKTKFDDANTDLGILANVRNAVQEYSDAGGNMGLLKGTEEEIKRKLGIDSGKASALAVQLWREFQTYRSNMTGAAFTPQESRDYASVNPTLGKSLDLNLSVIDGAMAQLGNRVNSTITRRIPDAQEIFDKAYGSASNQQTINISGKDYTVGQVYQDASGAKWVVDSNGKWTTQ